MAYKTANKIHLSKCRWHKNCPNFIYMWMGLNCLTNVRHHGIKVDCTFRRVIGRRQNPC